MTTPGVTPSDPQAPVVTAKPLGRWGIAGVVLGLACLLGAGAALVWGDEAPLQQCSTEKTMTPSTPSASGAATSTSTSRHHRPGTRPRHEPHPDMPRPSPGTGKLRVTQKIERCEPSDLTGGLALLLAVAGFAFVLPGLMRVMPPGGYKTPFGEIDTRPVEASPNGTTAHELAQELARSNREDMKQLAAAAGLPPPQPPAANA